MCGYRYHDGDAYIIDVSQSVEHDHPQALEFLRKDCTNVNGDNLADADPLKVPGGEHEGTWNLWLEMVTTAELWVYFSRVLCETRCGSDDGSRAI